MLAYDEWKSWRSKPLSRLAIDVYLEKISKYLDEFGEVCHAFRCRFEFAIIPDASALSGEHASDSMVTRVEELAESKGMRVIDLKVPLRTLYAKRGRLPVVPFDGHYNGEANAAIACEVAKVLRRQEEHAGALFGERDR
jgi:hypothetical protein